MLENKHSLSLLKGKNIKFLGAGLNKIESEKELYINKNGVKLGLLNFVTRLHYYSK